MFHCTPQIDKLALIRETREHWLSAAYTLRVLLVSKMLLDSNWTVRRKSPKVSNIPFLYYLYLIPIKLSVCAQQHLNTIHNSAPPGFPKTLGSHQETKKTVQNIKANEICSNLFFKCQKNSKIKISMDIQMTLPLNHLPNVPIMYNNS